MRVIINGMEYEYCDEIREQAALRESFCRLAQDTFGIDFRPWYEQGHWTADYIPHVLVQEGRVVANVSVNLMGFRSGVADQDKNQMKRFIQLGTVMTTPECQGRGLNRFLLERVLTQWQDRCAGIYLFANDSVLDFYPKFGFVKQAEWSFRMSRTGSGAVVRKLDLDLPADRQRLLQAYADGNPYSQLVQVGNQGLLMFYCDGPLRDQVYWLEAEQLVIIAEEDEAGLFCYDVFGTTAEALTDVLDRFAGARPYVARLGFAPSQRKDFTLEPLVEDSTFFVQAKGESPLGNECSRLPELSHA